MARMQYPLEYPPGVVLDDTVLARGGRFIDADFVRWVRGKPQLCGGFESLIREDMTGVCRGAFAWMDNSGRVNIAFGTHQRLYVWRGGTLSDITPYGPPSRLGDNPLTSANGSGTVTVAHTAHGLTTGASVKVYGAETFNGLDAANLNGVRTITVTGPNAYTFTAGASDTASAAGTGGGAAVVVVPQTVIPEGQINGTGTSGYGTGAYGVGGYGQPSTEDYFPRSWSFGALGEALVASYRGGAIFMWENDTAQRAEVIPTAPHVVSSIMVTPERVIVALGCNEEVSDTYNARCIRHSDPDDETLWTTTTSGLAREKILEGAGRIVAGRIAGPANIVLTDNEAWQMSYVGALDEVYSFTRLGEDCGLIGPNAVCVRNQRAFWMTPDIQFATVALGGEPEFIESPMRQELRDNLAPAQRDKIFASTISAFSEVWFFYPDRRDGLENSRAMFFSVAAGQVGAWWSKASLARTAFIDAGPGDYCCGVSVGGRPYWHERGRSADGSAISWRLAAGPQFIDSGRLAVLLRSFWPDFQNQVGTISLTLYTREKPQADPVTHGPYLVTAGQETVSLHVEGRLISWEMTGNSSPADFRLGTPIVEGRTTRRAK